MLHPLFHPTSEDSAGAAPSAPQPCETGAALPPRPKPEVALDALLLEGHVDEFNRQRPKGLLVLQDLKIADCNLSGFDLSEVQFVRCEFQNVSFTAGTLAVLRLDDCRGKSLKFAPGSAQSIELELTRCDFEDVRCMRYSSARISVHDTDLRGSTFLGFGSSLRFSMQSGAIESLETEGVENLCMELTDVRAIRELKLRSVGESCITAVNGEVIEELALVEIRDMTIALENISRLDTFSARKVANLTGRIAENKINGMDISDSTTNELMLSNCEVARLSIRDGVSTGVKLRDGSVQDVNLAGGRISKSSFRAPITRVVLEGVETNGLSIEPPRNKEFLKIADQLSVRGGTHRKLKIQAVHSRSLLLDVGSAEGRITNSHFEETNIKRRSGIRFSGCTGVDLDKAPAADNREKAEESLPVPAGFADLYLRALSYTNLPGFAEHVVSLIDARLQEELDIEAGITPFTPSRALFVAAPQNVVDQLFLDTYDAVLRRLGYVSLEAAAPSVNSRSSLIAGYIGHSENEVNAKIDATKGGLFVVHQLDAFCTGRLIDNDFGPKMLAALKQRVLKEPTSCVLLVTVEPAEAHAIPRHFFDIPFTKLDLKTLSPNELSIRLVKRLSSDGLNFDQLSLPALFRLVHDRYTGALKLADNETARAREIFDLEGDLYRDIRAAFQKRCARKRQSGAQLREEDRRTIRFADLPISRESKAAEPDGISDLVFHVQIDGKRREVPGSDLISLWDEITGPRWMLTKVDLDVASEDPRDDPDSMGTQPA